MIDFLKNYLAQKNIEGISNPANFDILKTQSGEGHINKKVVFYVFKNKESQPFLVIYTSRNKQANIILEKSIEAMVGHADFAPKLFFKDYYHDIFFAGVEFIVGDKLDLKNQVDLALAIDYLTSQYENQTQKKIVDFYKGIQTYFSKINIDIDSLVGAYIEEYADIELPIIKQHGDFQDNNLFALKSKLKIIDWDDYGLIDFPFFDFINLYLKCERKNQNFEFIEKKWQELSKNYGIDLKLLLLFYYLYDFLRKDIIHNKFERKNHLAELKNNLSKISQRKY